jgi:hypothetical protein
MKVFCPLSGKGTEDEGEFEDDYDFGKREGEPSRKPAGDERVIPGSDGASPIQNRPPRRRPVRCAQAGLL